MKIALVLGSIGDTVKSKLLGIKDNLDIDTFGGLEDFINLAIKRGTVYDRVLILSNCLNKKNLESLHNYWGMTNKVTQVVFLGKKNVDETPAKSFLDTFSSTSAAAMLVESTPVSLIAEAVLRPTVELNSAYGINYMSMELEEDFVVEQNSSPASEQVANTQEPVIEQPPQQPQKKKRSFFGFGSKKKSKENNIPAEQQTPIPPQQGYPQDMSTQVNQNTQGYGQDYNMQAQNYNPQVQNFNQAYEEQQAYNQGMSQPQDYNNDFNQPQDFNNGFIQSQDFSQPNNSFSQPQNYGQGMSQPQDYNNGFNQPNNSFSQPQDYGQDMSQPQDYNNGFNQPQDFNNGFNQSQDFSQPIGQTQDGNQQGYGNNFGQPQDYGQGMSQMQDYNNGFNQPNDSFSQPQDYNNGFNQPQTYDNGFNQPQDYNNGFNQSNNSFSQPQDYNNGFNQPQTYDNGFNQPQDFNNSFGQSGEDTSSVSQPSNTQTFEVDADHVGVDSPTQGFSSNMNSQNVMLIDDDVSDDNVAKDTNFNDFSSQSEVASSDSNEFATQPSDLVEGSDDNYSTEGDDLGDSDNFSNANDFSSSPNGSTQYESEFNTPEVDETFTSDFIEEVDSGWGTPTTQSDISEVDTDFSDDDFISEEDAYRQANDTPKVVTRTVVREIVRNVGEAGGTTLSNVYNGKLKKVVLVTGDRGTGVTSTALNIATTLAKKVNVLYFDCDIKRHGLLSYIDYASFREYDSMHQNGVKLCRNSSAFKNSIFTLGSNLYFLTSDYSCDVTEEELRQCAEVVSDESNNFDVVVVDCPVEYLPFLADLITVGQGVLCMEGTQRGLMNMLCTMEDLALQTRYKKALVKNGVSFATKVSNPTEFSKLLKYVMSIFEPDTVDWFENTPLVFNGKLTDEILNEVLEG